jgi:hypothetical protein
MLMLQTTKTAPDRLVIIPYWLFTQRFSRRRNLKAAGMVQQAWAARLRTHGHVQFVIEVVEPARRCRA